MTISFSCPACQASYKVEDKHAGKTTKCRKCGASIPIPDALTVAEQYKVCPYCAEKVHADAKKCKHCGSTIDVVLREAEEAKRIAERQSSHPGTPMVFMNAGGGGAAASSSSSAVGSAPAPAVAPSYVVLTSNRSRSTYVLLGIFLGLIGLPGIHNYYAGYTGRAAIQLLLSIFSCWILWIPVLIWVIIDVCTVTTDAQGRYPVTC